MELSTLIREALPELETGQLGPLLRDLEGFGRRYLSEEVAKVTSRVLLKSLDAFIEFSVRHLSEEDSEEVAAAYVEALNEQLEQLGEALFAYIPLQLAVAVAAREHGDRSAEANAARRVRLGGIQQVRAEVRDVFLAAASQEPED